MNRIELSLTIAIILFAAFVLGWAAHWLVHRFCGASGADPGEMDDMAKALQDAEETRDQAIACLQQREADLTSQLRQTKAELCAVMDGLREARREAEELRTHILKPEPGAKG
ncbi:MAG: hypothetical protein GDA52_05305 [Rhodobacteraceae bacterium]|nr:hypothetical protein [Paracoccaceae bacterium]